MQDGNSTSHQTHTQNRHKKITLTISLDTVTKLIIAGLVGGLFLAVYVAGARHGKEEQKAIQNASTTSSTPHSTLSNRWSAIGTVQEIRDNLITVRDSRGKEQQATINKDTTITDKTAKKVDIKTIKNDTKVIVSGTKDNKGSLTATRIRLTQ